MANKPRKVSIEDLTVAEMNTILGSPFCSDGVRRYFKYGNNLRELWEALWDNQSDYNSVRGKLGMTPEDHFPDEAIDHLYTFIKPEFSKETVRQRMREYFPNGWWKELPRDPDWEEKEFIIFRNSLEQTIETYLQQIPDYGLILIKKPLTFKKVQAAKAVKTKKSKK